MKEVLLWVLHYCRISKAERNYWPQDLYWILLVWDCSTSAESIWGEVVMIILLRPFWNLIFPYHVMTCLVTCYLCHNHMPWWQSLQSNIQYPRCSMITLSLDPNWILWGKWRCLETKLISSWGIKDTSAALYTTTGAVLRLIRKP